MLQPPILAIIREL